MNRRASVAAGLAALVAAAVAAPPATSARAPSAAEGAAIRAKVRQVIPPQDRRAVRITVRVSTVDRRWALARVLPRPGRERQVRPTGVALVQRAGRWRLMALGTTGLGCAMPRRVAVDLLGRAGARRGCGGR